jgi:nucleotide-binding universal stress UspA family protein
VGSSHKPLDTILGQSRELDAGLLVLGAFGGRPVRELLLGSVARGAIQKSTMPLFIFQ